MNTDNHRYDFIIAGFAKGLNLDMMHQCILVTYHADTKQIIVVIQPYPSRVHGGGEVAYCGYVDQEGVCRFTRIGPNLEFCAEVYIYGPVMSRA